MGSSRAQAFRAEQRHSGEKRSCLESDRESGMQTPEKRVLSFLWFKAAFPGYAISDRAEEEVLFRAFLQLRIFRRRDAQLGKLCIGWLIECLNALRGAWVAIVGSAQQVREEHGEIRISLKEVGSLLQAHRLARRGFA